MPGFYGATELFVKLGDEETHISAPYIGDGFEEEIYEACRCIAESKLESDILPHSESIAILELADRIREKIGLSYPMDIK